MKRFKSNTVGKHEIEHKAQLRKCAAECSVLLKYDKKFPLSERGDIDLYGNGVRYTQKGGTGSGDVNVREFFNIEEAFEQAGFKITSKEWLDAYDDLKQKHDRNFWETYREQLRQAGNKSTTAEMGVVVPEAEYSIPICVRSDTAVYVLSRISGEGSDRKAVRGDIYLTETEERDILHLSAIYPKFMLVLNTGGVVDLTSVSGVQNILLLGQLGSVTSEILVDIITGRSYPSGKLTTTWADVKKYASYENFGDLNDTEYREGIYVGYRYFDTFGEKVYFPFGYGLSFTSFTTEVERSEVDEQNVRITVSVKNTGNCSGKEVVQLYYSAPNKQLDHPYQELAAYTKTKELEPGEMQELIICFDTVLMSSYDTKSASYILEKGNYYIRVGNNSADTKICAKIVIDETAVVRKVKNLDGEVQFADIKAKIAEPDMSDVQVPVFYLKAVDIKNEEIQYNESLAEIPGMTEGADYTSNDSNLRKFIKNLNIEQHIKICIGQHKSEEDIREIIGNASSTVAGAAGETSDILKDQGIPSIILSDGPAGIRISTRYTLDGEHAKSVDPSISLGSESPGGYENESKDIDEQIYYQYCTAIPTGTALAQSWNNELCRNIGRIIGEEMQIFGIDVWLAPALNIHRSILCGRNFEYYSEDPVISGQIASAVVQGVQSIQGCAATIKHFVCNNQETNRFFSNSAVSERALREIYLKGFEICIRNSHPYAVMSSYNLVNGEHVCNRYDLLTKVLRNEWGFSGIVMTDWLVTGGAGAKGDKYPCASPAGCIKAGNDLIMPGMKSDEDDILDAINNKEHLYHLSEKDLQICAERIIKVIKTLK